MELSLLLQGSKSNYGVDAPQHLDAAPDIAEPNGHRSAGYGSTGMRAVAKFGEDSPRIRTISGPFPPHCRMTLKWVPGQKT